MQSALTQAFDENPADTVDVIVSYREPQLDDTTRKHWGGRRAFEDALFGGHAGFLPTRRFGHVPAVAGKIDRIALEALKDDPRVSYAQIDSKGGGLLKEAVPAIGGNLVKPQYGVTGAGVRVAVLDSGVSTTHVDLADSIVAQHCFAQFACPPLRSSEGTSAEDDNSHGSNVTGVITANGSVIGPGFAPGAGIVAVKVNDANDSGQSSDWVAGLDWVYANLATSKVKVVNLSLGTNATYATGADCDRSEPALARAVKNLVDAGVTVFAASGNRGLSNAMSAPACITGVIAVGAVYDSNVGKQPPGATTYQARWGTAFGNCYDQLTEFDQITCFTNSNARLDLVAPGAPILSAAANGRTDTYWGTSQASPAAAAVAALMLECNPTLTPAAIKDILVKTGVPRVDKKNGLSFPSLRPLEAVRVACGDVDAGGAGAGGASAGSGGAGGGSSPTSSGGASVGSGGNGLGGGVATGGASQSGGVPGAGGGPSTTGGNVATGGGVAMGGAVSGTSSGGGTALGGKASDDGCGCRVPARRSGNHAGTPDMAALAAMAAALLGLMLRTRRRRRRAPAQAARAGDD